MIKEADSKVRRQFSAQELNQQIDQIIEKICTEEGVGKLALQAGSRMPVVVKARKRIIQKLVGELGVVTSRDTRRLGVSTSAISKSLMREAKAGSQ